MMESFHDYIVLAIIASLSTLLILPFLRKSRRSSLPPGPPALPIIGHLHLLRPTLHQSLQKLATQYGPLIHLYLGSNLYVVASSPDVAKEFYKTHDSVWCDRPMITNLDYIMFGSKDLGSSPYGDYWKFMKKLTMSELLGAHTLNQHVPLRREEIKSFLKVILKKSVVKEEVDMGVQLIRLANNVISRMAMGVRCSENDDEAKESREIIMETLDCASMFNLSDFFWFCKNLDLQRIRRRLKIVRDKFDLLMNKFISQHEEAREKKKRDIQSHATTDLLDILLDVSENPYSEIKLTKEHIKAFLLGIFAGGSETSALTTKRALAELINHPEIMAKAREEIDAVVGCSRIVGESDITNLPYLQAIVKETLRLHPAAFSSVRESIVDCTILGYKIPARTRVILNIWGIGRDPKYWNKPTEFRPERFIENDQVDVRGQHFHLLPFGSGRRGCPGASFALIMVHIMLGAMIQCFDWKVSGKIDMEEGSLMTCDRACPLMCIPVPRTTPFLD